MMNHFILPTIYLLIPFGIAAIFVGFVEMIEALSQKCQMLKDKIHINFETSALKAIVYLVWITAFITVGMALYCVIY